MINRGLKFQAFSIIGLVAALLALSGCVQQFADGFDEGVADDSTGIRKQIKQFNQSGYDLMEQGKFEEAIAPLKQAVESIYELHPGIETLEEEANSSELMDSPFNNLSWAYNELGRYEESLFWIEKSMLLLPNDYVEYVNRGNALYGLDRHTEALTWYDEAIALDGSGSNAYYGRGMVHYELEKYKEALDDFEKVLSLDVSDEDAAEMKVYSLIAMKEEDKALDFAGERVAASPDNYAPYKLKSIVLQYTEDYGKTEAFYRQAAERFPDNPEVQEQLVRLFLENGRYDQAISYFQTKLELHPKQPFIAIALMNGYAAKKNFNSAYEVYKKAVKESESSVELHAAMGEIYANGTYYAEAVSYYDLALKAVPQSTEYAAAKLRALYYGNRLLGCVDYSHTVEEWPAVTSEMEWYGGVCRMEQGDYKGAVESFGHALDENPQDYSSYSHMAYSYLMLGDDEKAAEYAGIALDISGEDAMAMLVEQKLKEKKKPLGVRAEQFFRDHYLYLETSEEWDTAFAPLKKAGAGPADIAKAVEAAKKKDDEFTFVLYGDDYERLSSDVDGFVSKVDKEMVYVRIESFNEKTDDRFIEALDAVKNTERKKLVLDLRGNTGGQTVSANGILDVLLPDYVTSTVIYRDGETEGYYSDASQLKFDCIYVLVDENSASAAELLALGLKTYLPNTTLVGRDTFGKGIGQAVFEDKEAKLLMLVVNFYWNVKQTNIAGTKLKPDVQVKGDDLESFMKLVR
ncbi:tetratricopeptide repeat protein [Paenibacillus sp. GCM10027627]|uniref:tetratricopeptide repeat protein n=1 Tax=unclassified Paenibacillus TaxID=185978 RepID=UPI003636D8D4